jgi:hypothetical protein
VLIGDVIDEATTSRMLLPSVEEMRSRLRTGTPTAAPPTLAEYLPRWLAGRRNLAEGTRRSYDAHVRIHLVPNLGPIRIDRRRLVHLNDMVDAIEDRNTLIRAARASRDPKRRAAVKGTRSAALVVRP